MKLVHDVHRAATLLLAAAAARPGAPSAELAELRGFVVAALRHHHQSEDDAPWPIREAVYPEVAAGLPAPAAQALPAPREHARTTLDALRAWQRRVAS
jgi:hypothetical protein